MLQRVPAVQRVFEHPSNEKHRKVIDEGVKAHTPVLEPLLPISHSLCEPRSDSLAIPKLDGTVPAPDIDRLYGHAIKFRLLVLPVAPTFGFVAFAESIANAWDSTNAKDRAELKFPESFIRPSLSGVAMFSLESKSSMSFGRIVAPARAIRNKASALENLKQLREGPTAVDEIKEKLARNGIVVDSISFNGDSAAYEVIKKNQKVRIAVPNLDDELKTMYARSHGLLRPIAERLCFGFSPLF